MGDLGRLLNAWGYRGVRRQLCIDLDDELSDSLQARARGFLSPRGMAGLGWGFPMALGAKLAAPDRRVFCVVGDGGFAHVWSELETAHRHGIGVVVTVLNNRTLAYQRHAEDVLFGAHTSAVDLSPVDHAAIARACGLQGIHVSSAADYAGALSLALENPGTSVIDVIVDPDAHPPITSFENKPISRWSEPATGAI